MPALPQVGLSRPHAGVPPPAQGAARSVCLTFSLSASVGVGDVGSASGASDLQGRLRQVPGPLRIGSLTSTW